MSGYVPLNERRRRAHAKLLDAVGYDQRVLDVGCSSGYLAEPLSQRRNTIVGIELDPDAAREAERWCERVVVGDVESMELPFEPASFDVILCGDVIEHLRDPRAALARLRPFLRPGGRLVASTPNVANWAMRVSLLAGRWRYTDRGLLDRTHTHLFTKRTLVETVEAAGYRVERVDFTVPVPGDSDALDLVGRVVGSARPPLSAYQWLVVAAKPPSKQPLFTTPAMPAPADVDRVYEELKRAIDRDARDPSAMRGLAERFWAVSADKPLERRPGAKGRVAFHVKRVLRKLMRWYVEPAFAEQRIVNDALLRLVDDLARRVDELERRP